MDLVEVELFGEAAEPDLREERTGQVEELVLLVIVVIVGVLAQVFFARHASSRVDRFVLVVDSSIAVGLLGSSVAIAVGLAISICSDGLFGDDEPDDRVVQDIICGFGVTVGCRVLQNVFDIATGVVVDEVGATGVVLGEVGDIEDLGADGDVAGLLGVVRLDLSASEGWQRSGRHG